MQLFINYWSTSLTVAATAAATSLSVAPAEAAKLVGLGVGDHYLLTLVERDPMTGAELRREIVRATAVSGGSITVERAQEGTTAQVWDAGHLIEGRVTAETMETLRDSGGPALSDDLPPALGAASAGDSAEASRANHVHPLPTPAEMGAATAAQGALADTAVQPAALAVQLDLKVDKITGYGLSQENFTPAEKVKLAGLEGSHFRGTFLNLAALETALPTASPGDYADVDAGTSAPVQRYIWDESDGEWVAQAGSADPITAAQVKTLYESNPDTNAYTDAEKSKLAGIQAGAQANVATNLTATHGAATVVIASSTGDDATLLAATNTEAGAFTAANKVKLDGIAAGATANSSDAFLLARANHTGSQAISTVTGLQAVLDAKAAIAGLPSRTITASGPVTPADAGHWLICNSATPITLTIGAEATESWAIAGILPMFHILQIGAGAVTVVGDGFSVTLPEGVTNVISDLGFAVSLVRRGADGWSLIGAGELGATEWSAETVSQAEAEAGTATTRRAWTAERVRQAIASWWLTASTAFGRSLATATDAAAGRTALSVREQLVADRTYFVRTDGSDSNNGLSNTAGGAFLTIQKAVDVAATLDLGIFNCIIQVADGTYTGAVVLKAFVGAGQIRIIGNETTPANVIITGGGVNLISGIDFGRYLIAGVTIASTGARNIQVLGRGQLQYRNIVSQGAAGLNTHIAAINGAEVQSLGNITLNGNSQIGFLAGIFGLMNIRGQPITFASGTTITARGFQGSDHGRVDMINITFSGSFTGKRYEVNGLGAIFTNNAGESYIPGTIAGTTATGGIYY